MLTIRPALPTDAPVLSELAFRAKSHWGYPQGWLDAWKSELRLTPEYLGARSGFVAEQAGLPVGVCVLELRGNDASLEHLWIAPEFQHRGIGRALVARALAAAAGAGAARVEVVSDPFAEAFYARLGARRVGDVAAPMPGAPERVLPRLEFLADEAGNPANPVKNPDERPAER